MRDVRLYSVTVEFVLWELLLVELDKFGAYQVGLNSRGCVEHICQDIGEGIHMFGFLVKTPIGRCQVWEEAGSQLLGMGGEEFWLNTRGRF